MDAREIGTLQQIERASSLFKRLRSRFRPFFLHYPPSVDKPPVDTMDTSTCMQSRRRRLWAFLGRPWARRGIGASAEASETPGDTKFCSKCRAISAKLEEFLDDGPNRQSRYRARQRVTEHDGLMHVLNKSQRKRCSLCNFLARMVEAYDDDLWWWTENDLSLFIGSAKPEFGIRHEFSQIPESFFLWIWPCRPGQFENGNTCDPLFPSCHDDRWYASAGMALELSNDPEKISGRFVGPQTNFELVRSWFDDCAMHHGNTCQTDTSIVQGIPGFRVIDCSSRTLVYWSQLPKTKPHDYVALSYVWGAEANHENDGMAFWPTRLKDRVWETRGHERVKKPKANSDWTTDWRLPSNLPPLIEDAITAVNSLRFRYLWVDRYCIPQDNHEAKHTQIQNMDSIYGSASLTIIAAAGKDPSYGLPGVSTRYGRVQRNISTSVRIGSRTFVTVGTSVATEAIKHSKWNSRAWTMQEAFLSCRCLVFLENGAYFQCCSPRSHRFESIREPPALLELKSLSEGEPHNGSIHDPIILTKGERRRIGVANFDWCLELVKDYFTRSMAFESDSLNAFSGMLKYLQSLQRPIYNLWGVLTYSDLTSTASGQPISYNLVYGLAWVYKREQRFPINKSGQPTILPRKGIFPSWSWVDWRSRTSVDGQDFFSNHELSVPYSRSAFTSLVDLSVELHDGRIITWGKGYESDISWLLTSSQPPRVLHIHGYTSNPQLRYITEDEWGYLCDRTFVLTEQVEDHDPKGSKSDGHLLDCNRGRKWVLIDADGEHLQQPFETSQLEKPWCWLRRSDIRRWDFTSEFRNLSIDAYHLQLQRESRAVADDETFHSSTFTFRVILLGYSGWATFYMVLMKIPGTGDYTETFERVNVLTGPGKTPAQMEELLAKLAGKHAYSFPGTPWVKMSSRIA